MSKTPVLLLQHCPSHPVPVPVDVPASASGHRQDVRAEAEGQGPPECLRGSCNQRRRGAEDVRPRARTTYELQVVRLAAPSTRQAIEFYGSVCVCAELAFLQSFQSRAFRTRAAYFGGGSVSAWNARNAGGRRTCAPRRASANLFVRRRLGFLADSLSLSASVSDGRAGRHQRNTNCASLPSAG